MCEHSVAFIAYSGIPQTESFRAPLRTGFGVHVTHAQMVPEDFIVELDTKIFGFNRRHLVRHFLKHSSVACVPDIPKGVSMVVTTTRGEITAWGTIVPRIPCGNRNTEDMPNGYINHGPLVPEYKMGPVYATDEKSVRLLLKALVDSIPAESGSFWMHATVPASNDSAKSIMEELGLRQVKKSQLEETFSDDYRSETTLTHCIYATSNGVL